MQQRLVRRVPHECPRLRIVAAGDVALAWVETGGPSIPEEPVLQGFGSQLAQRSITGQLGGTLGHTWRQDGLEVRMRLPLDRLSS